MGKYELTTAVKEVREKRPIYEMKEKLLDKIRSRKACIAVIGLGHVGLPTATIFADVGFQVIGTDLKREVVEAVLSGMSHFMEKRLDEIVRKVVREKRLMATTNLFEAVEDADIVIVCVETPLTKEKEPNMAYLGKACRDVAEVLSKEMLVVVESTVPPGTTKNVVARILEEESRLKCGEDFLLAHCPERVATGKAVQEFVENDRVVGGYNPESAEVAAELFKTVTKGKVLITDCTSAEVAKLAENTFRDVNIAFANELALICEQIDIDVNEVIRLANTHPRVNVHNPGCGVGGPCIPKDPYLLLYPVKGKDPMLNVVISSRKMNEYMPRRTVKLVVEALKKMGKEVENSKVAVLGTAYKGEVDNAVNSPAEGIVRGLTGLGADVVVYDPHCEESFEARKAKDVMEAVEGADCLVITTEHTVFKKMDLERIKALMNDKPLIIDGRRLLDPMEMKERGFKYYGVGYGV